MQRGNLWRGDLVGPQRLIRVCQMEVDALAGFEIAGEVGAPQGGKGVDRLVKHIKGQTLVGPQNQIVDIGVKQIPREIESLLCELETELPLKIVVFQYVSFTGN